MRTVEHPQLGVHRSFSHLQLGKLPARDDPRTLCLDTYLDVEALPPIPAAVVVPSVPHWPMYGNDRLGDCTIASAGHMIQGWTKTVGRLKTLREATIERAYWNTGSGADDGRVELDVLNYWRNHGIGTDKILAYVAVNSRDRAHMKAAMYLFGGVYTGIGLPKTAESQSVWDVVGDGRTGASAPWSWGGHAVPYLGFDDTGVTLITWGASMRATWAFNDAYTDEAYAILSPDWLLKSGRSIHGFDKDALLRDLTALKR